MKSFVPYLVLLLAMGLSACREKTTPSEMMPCEKAALELYQKYADNTDLTVAYLGDLTVNGNCINALMLQASNEADWMTLKRDFGILPLDTSLMNCPNNNNPFLVGVGIETDFLDEAILDTLTDISQIPEEEIEKYTLIVADKIGDIILGFQADDSLLMDNAIIVGKGEVMPEANDLSYDDYILTVSRAVVVGMIEERIHSSQNDKANTAELINRNDRIMNDAQSHGHIGYVTAADNNNLALWLFFYNNQEECNNIINHIREDIIINE